MINVIYYITIKNIKNVPLMAIKQFKNTYGLENQTHIQVLCLLFALQIENNENKRNVIFNGKSLMRAFVFCFTYIKHYFRAKHCSNAVIFQIFILCM